ncbi:MAG TPA: alkaline phosphatase family protein [Longimicrobiales bacterium]
MNRFAQTPLLAALALLAGSATARAQQAAPARSATQAQAVKRAPAAAPRLIVFVTVDQMRAEYLDRWASQYTAGLARLRRGGAVFTEAYQDHAITETAPGHATVLSGREPWKTGIVRNDAGVQDPQVTQVGAAGPGVSPFRFRGSVLMDWLRTADPLSRGLSVSRKDRGAILPMGRNQQQVFWYATTPGLFVTSTWYADTLPGWVRTFNGRRLPQGYAGRTWSLLLPPSAYTEPDSVRAESRDSGVVFPHPFPTDSAAAAAWLPETPFMDEVTVALALAGVDALRLGAGAHTDLLAVSLSATDYIGHRYGPDSREIHDQLLRLDRLLGVFMDSLYARVDSSHVAFALTADHGVSPYPEVRAPTPAAAAAAHVELRPVVTRIQQALETRGVPRTAFEFSGEGLLLVDYAAFAAAGVNADSTVRVFADQARRAPGVARVDLVAGLARQDTAHDAIARRWLHMIPRDLPIAAVATLQPNHVWGSLSIAMHGQPYDIDAHVPIVFYGPWFRPGRYTGFVRVVDMAPTLARVAGVKPTEPIDGRALVQALRAPAPSAAAQQ